MASCSQIEPKAQAYVDGELSSAERVVFDHHVQECPACRALLNRHRRTCAMMFEAFSADRLRDTVRARVLENLPEIDPVDRDLAGINWRAKHPLYWRVVLGRLTPVAVVCVLIVSVLVLREKWPTNTAAPAGAVGVVAQNVGPGEVVGNDTNTNARAQVGGFVQIGDAFRTGPAAGLMLELMGPTEVKMNEHTRVSIESERRLRLEEGEVWLSVGRDGRLFRVITPNGNVTVYGTTFVVRVTKSRTVVTVLDGQVKADNETSVFRMLHDNQQVEMAAGDPVAAPVNLNTAPEFTWAERLMAEERAKALFQSEVLPKSAVTELPAKDLFWIDARVGGRHWTVGSVRLSWDADAVQGKRCGYTVYVYDEKWNPITKESVPGALFEDKEHTAYEIPIPADRTGKINDLIIELVPDFSDGKAETPIRVSAAGS